VNPAWLAADIRGALVVLAAHPDGFQAAATLAGALSGPVLGHLPAAAVGSVPDRYECAIADVAAALDADSFAKARKRGAAMTHEEIVAFALGHLARLAEDDS
jgi:hypothetical protein